VNTGQASARDYTGLIQHVQRVVEAETGIRLALEIELIGGQA
jgi:UDP-N-acetylenolpyruvoylglucosamine reductase